MSGVISIVEDTHDLAVSNEVNGITYTLQTHRRFDLIFSNDTDPVAMPILAIRAVAVSGSSVQIPLLWQPHPYDPWSYVIRKTAKTKGGYNWEVVCEYSGVEEPLTMPYRLSYSYSTVTELIDRDLDGQPIMNSANETPDPPLTEEYVDLVMRFEIDWETINSEMMADYGNAVNSDTWRGYAPGTCLIKNIDANAARVAGLTYYAVSIEIHVRPDGWERRYLDEGYRTIVKDAGGNPELDDDGYIKYQTITDENGQPLTAPAMLDGHGSRLAEGADPVFLERKTKKERPFSVLNLGL